MFRRFIQIALVAGVMAPGAAFASCATSCLRAIDPGLCEDACHERESHPGNDQGAYCRDRFYSNPDAWWTECGGGESNGQGGSTPASGGSGTHCPDGPHCI